MKEAKTILAEILSERCAVNPRYSLRAFARDLDISPQQLSNVINGRRGIGPALAETISLKLNLPESLKVQFTESLKARFSRSKVQRKVSKTKMKILESDNQLKTLEVDVFKVISNWYHFTLVELIKISKSKFHHPTFFSSRLGIPESEVLLALERLERLNLIRSVGKKWVVNQETLIADFEISPESVKIFHKQILEKAMKALAFQSSGERYGSSSTLSIKLTDLERAKELIQKFRLEFDELISDPANGEEVFGLSIQFFKLTQ